MKKIISLVALALLAVGSAKAIVVQKAILKNGCVLYGYIQQQDGMGKLTFRTDSAVICISGRCMEIVERSNESGGDQGVIGNIEFLRDSVATDQEGPTFEDLLRERHRVISNVVILEKGTQVKYLERTPNTYYITWKDIITVESLRRPKTALSGIDRVCNMKDGKTYEGQYAGETEDMQKLYMTNGVVQSFWLDDVVKYIYKGINPKQDMFAQSELLDIIKTKNGREIRGIITEQNYSNKKDADNYFLVMQPSGTISSIKLSDIVETRKEVNAGYAPKYDVLLKEGEVVVNRQEVVKIDVKEKDENLVLDSLSEKVVINHDANNNTKIIVEYRLANGSNVEAYQIVKLTNEFDKKTKENQYFFTYRDLVNSTIRPMNIETSANQTTKAEYIIGGKGAFILYDAKNKKAIPFVIK